MLKINHVGLKQVGKETGVLLPHLAKQVLYVLLPPWTLRLLSPHFAILHKRHPDQLILVRLSALQSSLNYVIVHWHLLLCLLLDLLPDLLV